MQHLDEGTIHAWLDGALSSEESAGVERHVAQCKECASLVAEARGMIAGASRIVSALDVVPGGVIPKMPRTTTSSRSLWRSLHLTPSRAALAATLVIAFSTLLTLRHDTPTKIIPTAVPRSPVVASEPAPAVVAEPSDKSALERQKADVARPSAKAEQPARRDVADMRIRVADSTSAAPVTSTKPSLAEVTAQNAATTKRVAAAAPVAAPAASGTGAVAADAARPMAKANVDTARASAASAPGFAARRFQRAEGVRENVELARLASQIFLGCYQLDSTFKDSSVPRRFALAPLQPDTVENVVHAVTPDGRMGDGIVGSRWMPLSATTIELQFPARDKLQSVTIGFPTGTATGVAAIVGDQSSATFTVRHTTCLP